MYKFTVNEKQFNIPSKWEELTMEDYLKIIRIPLNDSDYTKLLLTQLVGMSDEDINELTIMELNTILDKFEYLTKQPKFKAKKEIKFNGEVYSFPVSFNHLKLGEVISIKTYQEKYGETSIPYIVAILLRKMVKGEDGKMTIEKFDASIIEDRVKLFMSLPISDFMGSLNFFLTGTKTS